MTETGKHPAIFAGLLGSAAWGTPTLAFATPLEDVVSAVTNSIVLQFLVGCAAGALVAGVVTLIGNFVTRDREEDEADEADAPATLVPLEQPSWEAVPAASLDDDRWSESSLNLVRAQVQAEEGETTGNLGRVRNGQLTLELEDRERPQRLAAQPISYAGARKARHFAAASEPATVQASKRRSARHFAGAAALESLVPAFTDAVETLTGTPAPSGRHFKGAEPVMGREAAPVAAAEPSPSPAASKPAAAPVAEAPAPVALTPRERLAQLPTIESRRRTIHAVAAVAAEPKLTEVPSAPVVPAMPEVPQAVTPAPSAEASDGRLTAADKMTLRQRLARRTSTVRAVLAERLSPDAMSSIPQITRADGTVGDITPSWFDQTLVPVLANITGITGRLSDTTPRMSEAAEAAMPASVAPTVLVQDRSAQVVQTPAPVVPVVSSVQPVPNAVLPQAEATPSAPTAPVAKDAGERPAITSHASYIAARVAEVDLGMFPERRRADELEHEDVWEVALAAMGENIDRETPAVFQDVVGGPSTIDDPDGLEGPTGFIPFRVPAGRPDVVDTESYIDYLIDDELSQNGSPTLQRSKRGYLRIIEGGTSPLKLRRRTGETGPIPRGRHFAQPRYAQEA